MSTEPIPPAQTPQVNPAPPASPSLDDMRAQLAAQEQQRADACMADVTQVLERHGMRFDISLTVTALGNRFNLNLVSR